MYNDLPLAVDSTQAGYAHQEELTFGIACGAEHIQDQTWFNGFCYWSLLPVLFA